MLTLRGGSPVCTGGTPWCAASPAMHSYSYIWTDMLCCAGHFRSSCSRLYRQCRYDSAHLDDLVHDERLHRIVLTAKLIVKWTTLILDCCCG